MTQIKLCIGFWKDRYALEKEIDKMSVVELLLYKDRGSCDKYR